MRTSELSGAALDWAVAKALGEYKPVPNYSTDWAQGGPIIEREKIAINYSNKRSCWFAENYKETKVEPGATPLIAAMRCYVASKLGEEVQLPEELSAHDAPPEG